MANEQNLVMFQKGDLSSEEAKKRGTEGGKKSAEARRRKKDLFQLMEKYMTMQVKSDDVKAQLMSMGFSEDDCTNRTAFLMNMQKHAAKGNSSFAKLIYDMECQTKQRNEELKKMKLENAKLEAELEEQRLRIEKLKADMNSKNDVEDLTPLAKLLQDDDDEQEIDREVSEDNGN